MYRMSSLLTHALTQEISLPVACLLVLMRSAHLNSSSWHPAGVSTTASSASTNGSPVLWARALACLQRTSCAISLMVCSARMRDFFSFGLLLVGGRRNIVVTPGRAFQISGLIMLVLLCPLSGIIEPRVGEIVRQTAFTLSDLVDESAQVGAAPTTGGCGTGSGKGHHLAAVALKGYGGRMPLVDLAKGHFAALVVGLDAFEDLHHRLLPLSPAVLRFIGRAFVPGDTC